jgi:hypothetical protein
MHMSIIGGRTGSAKSCHVMTDMGPQPRETVFMANIYQIFLRGPFWGPANLPGSERPAGIYTPRQAMEILKSAIKHLAGCMEYSLLYM